MPTLHTLHLIEADLSRRMVCVRAIRAAFQALGESSGLREAYAVITSFESDGQALIGTTEDEDAANEAASVIEAASGGELRAIVDADAATLAEAHAAHADENSDPSDDDEEYEARVYRSAMVLLVPVEGNPGMARSVALSLADNSNDTDFWLDVAAAVMQVFPPQLPTGMVVFQGDAGDEF